MSSELWLLVSLVIVLGLGVWKGLGPVLARLDARADSIRSALDEARAMREEAEEDLKRARLRVKSAEEEGAAILAAAERTVERLREQSAEALRADLERRRRAASERLAQAEGELREELRRRIAELAVSGAEEALRRGLSEEDHRRLSGAALDEAADRLN
ncbi:MAG: ATP synthase F0 subunit B [Alphaproteobacteria bacterium]|nr:ATP synthase F0 subunit B [Alphaproteobacteria bacterium]MDA7983805.1 ATP synthase F0 subunit B [Alphaproteobacteria bacterium]MDA7989444.1 ATP synthase F0 subunit B [Alphaproteobacteria bacterium]MDA8002199.1 ATP synthase F0 subunit B [Alphaproteobacteria bacterium]MDA8004324.1 ATP synthase F0 subunit B [Alphaproteobacteria bacterium]